MLSPLAQPVTLPFSGRVAPNTFLKAPMQEQLGTYDSVDVSKRGQPTPQMIKLYEEWGKGGFGIIVTGNIMINHNHLGSPSGDTAIDIEHPNSWIEEFASIAKVAKAEGSLVLGQVNHPGRQASTTVNPHLVSASDIPLPGITIIPTALTIDGIEDVVRRHAHAADILYKAGFDGIELHAAHGYLLTQFLSPRTNKRIDQYGGSLENRSRIIFEIIRAIREKVTDPSFIVAIKLNTADFSDGGFSDEDSQMLSVMLEEQGHIDFIELSGGTYESMPWLGGEKSESTKKREAFFLDFAAQLRPQLRKTKLVVTGGFRSAAAMIEAIKSQSTDLIGIGRPAAAEPHLAKLILSGQSTQARTNYVPSQLGIAAAGPQIKQIGSGERIWDYSQQEDVDRFMGTLQPVAN